MKKNKNGFTLVELIAVIVILIVIILIAITAVRKASDKANDKALNANAISYVKAVNEAAIISKFEPNKIKAGIFTIEDANEFKLSLEGDKPTGGYLYVEEYETKCSCLEYGKYYVIYNNGKYQKTVKGSCPAVEDTCDINEDYAGMEPAEFDYTGEIATFVVPKNGTYKLETWGAQGGNAGEYLGGYGGYSKGEIRLNKGDTLYIAVGGAGAQTTNAANGGFNGGGASGKNSAGYRGTGGGATSISYTTGVLASLSLFKNNIIIVAGGGGGANVWTSQYGYGGAGGGFTGMNGTTQNHTIGTGGTQTAGGTGYQAGTFGQGASAPASAPGGAGGGGGYFGGGSSRDNAGAGGGSGYIGFESLSNKSMYCYNCTESNDTNTKTVSTTCFNDTPTEKCAKAGNGYAKISFKY